MALTLFAQPALARNKVIYGDDDRVDLISGPADWDSISLSTLAIINKKNLKSIRNGESYTFESTVKSLQNRKRLCEGEVFADQPTASHCSAFLIGPDTILTAGHCAKDLNGPKTDNEICQESYYVFDYYIQNPDAPFEIEFTKGNVFSCKKVIKAVYESRGFDYAIIQLDRKVSGRTPLKLNSTYKAELGEELTIIGHPWGLPSKFAGGAKVVENRDNNVYFSATLDSFGGNSGSAVFNSSTKEVEGILVRGKADEVLSYDESGKSCYRLNHCDDSGKNCLKEDQTLKAEEVTKISSIAQEIAKALKSDRQ